MPQRGCHRSLIEKRLPLLNEQNPLHTPPMLGLIDGHPPRASLDGSLVRGVVQAVGPRNCSFHVRFGG